MSHTTQRALLVIDVQNDYFADGKLPLWKADDCLHSIVSAIGRAHQQAIPVILVQHIADPAKGASSLFAADSHGVQLHPALLAASPHAPVIIKQFADAFVGTGLKDLLTTLGTTELLVCGMMTQNCVTHTAISRGADDYQVTLLKDCSTTVDALIHGFALNAVATRIMVADSLDVL